MQVRQVNFSHVMPGAIKAFHLHFNQEDVWFVPATDRLLIGLVDVRAASPTYQQRMRFALGGGQNRMVYIPRGVAHGAVNLGTQPALMLYLYYDVSHGQLFQLPVQLPAGWEIDHVETGPALRTWDVWDDYPDKGKATLLVDLPRPVTPGDAKRDPAAPGRPRGLTLTVHLRPAGPGAGPRRKRGSESRRRRTSPASTASRA